MSDRRDDFTKGVKRALAERAAWICSNPSCGALTIGPSDTDDEKSVNVGTAAHIHAAAPGGCRYDPNQSAEQRASITNGIWLCRTCGTRVDTDCAAFPADLLRQWKTQHEAAIKEGGLSPEPLAVTISTLTGLRLPATSAGGTISSSHVAALRQHELRIVNRSGRELQSISIRLQFPELVLEPVEAQVPAGSTARAVPDRMQLVAFAEGGGSVTFFGPPRPAAEYKIEIDRLLPHQYVLFVLTSVIDDHRWHHESDAIEDYLEGTFLFRWGHLHRQRRVVVPLEYDAESRHVRAHAMCLDPDGLRLAYRQTM